MKLTNARMAAAATQVIDIKEWYRPDGTVWRPMPGTCKVLNVLLAFEEASGEIFVSIDVIAQITGFSTGKAYRCLKDLRNNKLIEQDTHRPTDFINQNTGRSVLFTNVTALTTINRRHAFWCELAEKDGPV
jgi:hypothetical protein